MAIFDVLKKNRDKKSAEEVEKEVAREKETAAVVSVKKETERKDSKKDSKTVIKHVDNAWKTTTLQNILKHPRITEKAAILAERGAYTFEVDSHATKIEIARAVKQIYNVEPLRVNIIKLPAKKVFIRGRRGTKKAVKKAIVYLKEGDKIEFV